MSTDITDNAQPGWFDRVFGLQKHEYVAVAWSFVYFFCILSAYYMLRPVRETMAVGGGVIFLAYLRMRALRRRIDSREAADDVGISAEALLMVLIIALFGLLAIFGLHVG